jgi:hypothetical protein
MGAAEFSNSRIDVSIAYRQPQMDRRDPSPSDNDIERYRSK